MEERIGDLFDEAHIGAAKHQEIDGRKNGDGHGRRAHHERTNNQERPTSAQLIKSI